MPTFANGVSALLTTYDNCLELLKSFKHRPKTTPSGEPDPDAAAIVAARARLRRSIRSDRSRISRVYDSKLSLSGSLLEKGDSRARSSLKRVLRRLSAALTRVLRTATGAPDAVIDYESLASLSNASRIDAIKTIDGLSRRISDLGLAPRHQAGKTRSVKSHSSVKSEASVSSSSSSSSGKEKKKKKKAVIDSSSKTQTKEDGQGKDAAKNRGKGKEAVKSSRKIQLPPTPPVQASVPVQAPEQEQKTDQQRRQQPHDDPDQPEPRSHRGRSTPTSTKRISIASFASDSTKLGEIAMRPGLDTVVDEDYEIRPVYPLRPYAQTVVPERRRGFWSRISGRA